MKRKDKIFRKTNKIVNSITSFYRDVPNFLIAGTSFCGKTLLYDYLTQNPSICKNLREETGFFQNNLSHGISWYKSNFPTKGYRKIKQLKNREKIWVGETTSLLGRHIPKKISEVLNEPKIIIILRNPVNRAYSRYLSMKRAGYETLSFNEVIENENEEVVNDERKLIDQNIWSYEYNKTPFYLLSGIYIEHIVKWSKIFPLENILFLSSEELFENPLKVSNKCFEFLGISKLNTIKEIGINYEKDMPDMSDKTRIKLSEYFSPHNKKLFTLLNKEFDWSIK